jgi:thiamine pyrophosphokinase
MKLPVTLERSPEWTLLGPLGPALPLDLGRHPIIGVDGGASHSSHLDIWIGDSDSYKDTVQCENIFHFSPQKAQSDLSLAFELLQTGPAAKLHLWGFLGGRKDHELFNLGEAFQFLNGRHPTEIIFYNREGRASFRLFSAGRWELSHFGLFSMGALGPVEVTLTGHCEYTLPDKTLLQPLSSQGLSNSAHGKFVLNNEGPIFIYFPETP